MDHLEFVNQLDKIGVSLRGTTIEGTAKERFTSSSEMNDLMRLAGL